MRKWFSLFVILALVLGVIVVPVSADNTQTFTVVLKGDTVSESALAAVQKAGGTVLGRIDAIGVLQVQANPATFLKAVMASGVVDSVGPSLEQKLNLPDTPEALAGSPADPANPADYVWGVDRVTNNKAAWAIHTGTRDVVVAVLDTGLDVNHPDLAVNVVPGSKNYTNDFGRDRYNVTDINSHGTHVAGTIAANGRIKGVAPNVGLRSYKVLGGPGGSGQQIWITTAIVEAANDGVDVINMSLGGERVRGQWYYIDPATGERIRLGNDAADMVAYHRAIQYAVKKGVTVVAAAGNDAWDLTKRNAVTRWYQEYLHSVGYTMYEIQGATFDVPGGVPGVVTVSASGGGFGTEDRLAFYSNFGTGVINISAPGGDYGPLYPIPGLLDADYYKHLVLSTTPTYYACNLPKRLFGDCNYGFKAGTSMATPHVAGAAALYISGVYAQTGKKPSPAQVAAALYQTADDAGKVGYDGYYGQGIVNVYRALGGK